MPWIKSEALRNLPASQTLLSPWLKVGSEAYLDSIGSWAAEIWRPSMAPGGASNYGMSTARYQRHIFVAC